MASPEKRCLYEVLGLNRDCTADEIRSTYRKLALQRHPDKLVKSGVSESEATASFQELVNAYEVLSDPRERAWYDSHRSQILFTNSKPSSSSNSSSLIVPDLFSYFSNSVFSGYGDSGKGFYKVYAALFDKIYASEVNFSRKLGLGLVVKVAPVMGNLESPYTQVTAFYGYWIGFATVMDFCWVDEYDAMMGPNRKARRVMEEENKKVRKKARREYNETVRGLAEFVKKRDKRVIDMQVKRSEEMERKREEEREKKKKLEREKMEKARRYEEPEWANVDEEEIENGVFEEVEDDGKKKGDGKELYCVACGKKFKSEKQWMNHEQSKKHKEKVAELKEAFGDEEREEEEEVELEDDGGVDGSGSVSVDDGVDELQDQFDSSFEIQDRKNGDEAESSEEEEFDDFGNGGGSKVVDGSFGLVDDEASVLEPMVSGHKNRKNSASMHQSESNGKASETKAHGEDDSDEIDSMAYNNWKQSTKTKSKGKASETKTHGEDDSDETDSMVYNNRKKSTRTKSKGKASATKAHVKDDNDESDSMAYDDRKSRKSRRARRENGQKSSEEATRAGTAETNGGIEENSGCEDSLNLKEESSSHSVVENAVNGEGDDQLKRSHKGSKQSVDKKSTAKSDTNTKSKNSSKGKKQKATSKTSGTVCDTCGEDFESRNKLYKHIGDTGHATLKSR